MSRSWNPKEAKEYTAMSCSARDRIIYAIGEGSGCPADHPDPIAQLRNLVDSVGVAETIGERIKRERMALGLTQRELADAVGVGVPHISKVEAGRENPSDELLLRLADVFEIDPEELLLVARRIPQNLAEDLAESPADALAFLRTWPGAKAKKP